MSYGVQNISWPIPILVKQNATSCKNTKYDFSLRKYSSNAFLILYILYKATFTINDSKNNENVDFAQKPHPENET